MTNSALECARGTALFSFEVIISLKVYLNSRILAITSLFFTNKEYHWIPHVLPHLMTKSESLQLQR